MRSKLTTLDRADYRVVHMPSRGRHKKRGGGDFAIINRWTGEVIGRRPSYQQAVEKLEAAIRKERALREEYSVKEGE